jgi:hypothetical protein
MRNRVRGTLDRRQRRSAPYVRLLCALLLTGLAAACGRDAAPLEPGTTGTAPVPTPVPDASGDQPPVSAPHADSGPAEAGIPSPTISASNGRSTRDSKGAAVLRAVRIGGHTAADRLVFEFDGVGIPAWHVEYVDRPLHECGSGEVVPVAGDAWLQVEFVGAQAHTEAGAPASGPRRRAIALPSVRELVRTCDFEGHVTWVAGVASPNRYTPRTMSAPPRLVIDIAH